MSLLKRFLTDCSGATAVEYALLAMLMTIVTITALSSMGTTLKTTCNEVSSNLK